MEKVKVNARVYAALYLGSKDASQLVSYSAGIIEAMTGNLSTPSPIPTLMDLQTTTTLVATSIPLAASGGPSEKATLDLAVNALQFMLVRMKQYVQNTANATPETAGAIILSCGMAISKTPEKSPVPIAVTNLTASYTGQPGTILVEWSKANFAKSYLLLISTTPNVPTSWTTVVATTRKKMLVGNLLSSTRYYFRVVSVGITGNSDPSVAVNNITTMVDPS